MNANFYSRTTLATSVFTIQRRIFFKQNNGKPGVYAQGAIIWLPNVRELYVAGDRVYLPDGMPQGIKKWTLWRFHI
jgi:hypothetical protein